MTDLEQVIANYAIDLLKLDRAFPEVGMGMSVTSAVHDAVRDIRRIANALGTDLWEAMFDRDVIVRYVNRRGQ